MRANMRCLASVLLLGMAFAGCSPLQQLNGVTGSGCGTTETRAVSGIGQVELRGTGHVSIYQGVEYNLRIEAENSLIPLITTTVYHSLLTIGWQDPHNSITVIKPVRVLVTMPTISQLQVTGLGELQITDLVSDNLDIGVEGAGRMTITRLRAAELTVQIAGMGQIDSAGEIRSQDVHIMDSGTYRASDLVSLRSRITVPCLGSVTVRADQMLDVHVDGSGTVRYSGDPAVTQQAAGLGRLMRVSERRAYN